MVAGHLGLIRGTHSWAQESWEVARGGESDTGGKRGQGLLAVCGFLGFLRLEGAEAATYRETVRTPLPLPAWLKMASSRISTEGFRWFVYIISSMR
jgi:hypothetical protein